MHVHSPWTPGQHPALDDDSPLPENPGGSQSLCECLTQAKNRFTSVPLQPSGGVSLNAAGGWCWRVVLEGGTRAWQGSMALCSVLSAPAPHEKFPSGPSSWAWPALPMSPASPTYGHCVSHLDQQKDTFCFCLFTSSLPMTRTRASGQL